MVKNFSFSKCVDGYMLSVYARHLSERTIESYEVVLRRIGEFLASDPTHRGDHARPGAPIPVILHQRHQ